MENVRLLTISELIRCARPHTAASSPRRSTSPLSPKSYHPESQPPPCPAGSNSNPKILTPLDCPALLVGTLTLPGLTLRCPNKNCLQFADDSSAVCCDVLGLDLRIIGKTIHVLAWNFIPFKHFGGGFLEIIKWAFPGSSQGLSRCSNLIDSFRLFPGSCEYGSNNSKSRYRIYGALESLSPVTVVPCTVKSSDTSNSTSLRGFLVRLMACKCKLCSSEKSMMDIYRVRGCHSFTNPVIVYFCGSAWCWHPVITKLIGNLVILSGLKKKLIFIGKESQLMFVTADNSVLNMPSLSEGRVRYSGNFVKGNGESGTYTGIVNGVYMQGMVVGLDKEVWLLLTDQLLTPPHSLRVGAVISVRNAHFVNPRFSWAKMLILGSCFQTSISVESFSPLETGCLIISQSESLLGKFIESLTFSARLWALILASCFCKKFSGILSEKEILGSRHSPADLISMVARRSQKVGLAQIYANSHLPPSVFRARHEIFMDFHNHESCGSEKEPYHVDLKLVLPISSFIHHCETMWIKALIPSENGHTVPWEGSAYPQSKRMTFQSEVIGIVLAGILKMSPSSGRLQLVDASGSIDVIIPYLPSSWNTNSIYEVMDYSLTVEGIPQQVDRLMLLDDESFSCGSIFNSRPLARGRNLSMFLYFYQSKANCRNLPFYPSVDCKDDFNDIGNGIFHLLQITHKFPWRQKCRGDPTVSERSTMFIEAIVLPWYLFLYGKDKMPPEEVSMDQMNFAGENFHAPSKRRKVDQVSSSATSPGTAGSKPSTCCKESIEEQRYPSCSSHDFPCLATVRGIHHYGRILYRTKANLKIDDNCNPNVEKVLVELQSESFFKYQIGGYYMLKHHLEDPFCNIKKSDNVSGVKVIKTSRTEMWSLSLSSEVLTSNKSSQEPSLNDSSPSNDVVSAVCQAELLLRATADSSVNSSDVLLYASADVIGLLGINANKLEPDLIKPVESLEEISNLSSCTETIMTASRQPSSADSISLLPEGNLITLSGDVVAVYSFEPDSADKHLSFEGFSDLTHYVFSHRTSGCCIHVSTKRQIVRIFGFVDKHVYPTGFGPGTNATFYRILELRGSNMLMLTAVSFIEMNSIKMTDEPSSQFCSNFCSAPDACYFTPKNPVSSGSIYELIKCSDGNLKQFRCRVVAVHVLVMEKVNSKHDGLLSGIHSRPLLVDIPLAGFVLDDGSSSCFCWANAVRAATFLRLNEELPRSAFENIGCTSKFVGACSGPWITTKHHLERILKKYGQIIVKNYGSMFDSSAQDLNVSVSSDNALVDSDENLLKLIVFNSCFGALWNVIAGVMDPNTVNSLAKEHHVEMEMTMFSMQHLWAKEVCYVNPLTQARDLCQELINR